MAVQFKAAQDGRAQRQRGSNNRALVPEYRHNSRDCSQKHDTRVEPHQQRSVSYKSRRRRAAIHDRAAITPAVARHSGRPADLIAETRKKRANQPPGSIGHVVEARRRG